MLYVSMCACMPVVSEPHRSQTTTSCIHGCSIRSFGTFNTEKYACFALRGGCGTFYNFFDPAGLVKITLSGSLPVMNSERYSPPRPLSHSTRQPQQQQQQQQQPQPQPQHRLLPRGNFGKQAAVTVEQQGNRPSQQAKAEWAELLAEEAANKRPIGRPKRDCYGLTIWVWIHL